MECSANRRMSRDDQRPLVGDTDGHLVEEDEFNTSSARSSFRRSKSTNFTRSNHGYELSCYDNEESDLRGSMRAASRKYQESVARLQSSQRGESKNNTVANGKGSNRFTYVRQSSSPASHNSSKWETGSAISNISVTTESSGYHSNRTHNTDFFNSSHVSGQSGFISGKISPNIRGNSPANDSGYYGNNTPVATQNRNAHGSGDKSRVTISRNSRQYADVTQHVTCVSSIRGHQEDTTDGASDEEADSLHSMSRKSPFRRSMPRRHSYHNLKNAYQSQMAFKQRQQMLQEQNQNQTIEVCL